MRTARQTQDEASEVAILGRLLAGKEDQLTPELATYFLRLDFDDRDKARMADLAGRNQMGQLTQAEREELESFANAGCLLGILQSRARKYLKKAERTKVS